jgi:hypothetical protein
MVQVSLLLPLDTLVLLIRTSMDLSTIIWEMALGNIRDTHHVTILGRNVRIREAFMREGRRNLIKAVKRRKTDSKSETLVGPWKETVVSNLATTRPAKIQHRPIILDEVKGGRVITFEGVQAQHHLRSIDTNEVTATNFQKVPISRMTMTGKMTTKKYLVPQISQD